MTPDVPRPIYVGDKSLSKEDRLVLAVWCGQTIPGKGDVRINVDRQQLESLKTLLHVLGKRTLG